jgi:hypothetical protein
MASITRAITEIEVALASAFRLQETPGFATVQAAALSHNSYAMTDCFFDQSLNALTLFPSYAALTFADMDMAAWTLTGDWRYGKVDQYRQILLMPDTAAGATAAASVGTMPANPTLHWTLARHPELPDSLTDQTWEFHFGWETDPDTEGFVLRLSRRTNPEFYGPAVDGTRPKLGTYALEESEREPMAHKVLADVRIHCLLGDCYIFSTLLARPWVVRGVGDVGAGFVKATCTNGAWAMRHQPVSYPTSGYIITDWIDHGGAMPITCGQPFPLVQPDSVTVTITEESTYGANDRKYRIAFTGDGWHTPLVRAWQAICRPASAATISEDWYPVDNFMVSGDEKLMVDPAASQVTVTFQNHDTQFLQYLEALGLSFKQSVCAARITLGYEYDDGTTDTRLRLVGHTEARGEASLLDTNLYSVTFVDRARRLARTDLYNAPCLLGWPVEEAIAMLAEFGGVAAEDIIIHAQPSTRSVDGGDWWVRYDPPDIPIELYLTGNEQDFTNPSWLNNGEKVWEVMQRICQRYGLVAEFGRDGMLFIRAINLREASTTPKAVFTTAPGGDDSVNLRDVTVNWAVADAANVAVAEGRDQDQQAIIASVRDEDSISNPDAESYLAGMLVDRFRDDDLTTQESCNLAALSRLRAKLPRRTVELTSKSGALWSLYERDLIQVTDANTTADGLYFRVVSVSTKLGLVIHETTVQAKQITLGEAALYSGAGQGPLQQQLRRAVDALRPRPPGLTAAGSGIAGTLNTPEGDRWFTIAVSDIGGPDRIKP